MRTQICHSTIALALVGLSFPAALFAGTATVDVTNEIAGKTPTYIGFNYGHYMPGSNVSAWVERSKVNCFRVWASPSYYEPSDDLDPWGDGVSDATGFENRKAALRNDPLSLAYINWDKFNHYFENSTQSGGVNRAKLNYSLGELRRMGITPLLCISREGWTNDTDWASKWEHWQYYYALAFHLARNYDVTLYETFNEPDCNDCTVEQLTYTRWMRYAGDAIRSATADVNRLYGKNLSAVVMAPTLTHSADSRGNYHMDADPDSDPRDDVYGWGQRTLQFLRTDYRGNSTNYDTFNIYSTHKYGCTGSQFYSELGMLDSKMKSYTPTGVALPVFYTEFNRYSSTDWDVNHTGETLNTPSVFTELGLIYAKSMLRGVHGMIAFKYSNTDRPNYGPMPTGFHYTENDGNYDTGGAKKGVEVVRFMAKGFANARNRYKTTTSGSGYNAYTSYDPARNCYYVLAVNSSASESCSATYTMSGLGIYTDTVMSVEEVSAAHQGEVVSLPKMTSTRTFTLTQPKESVWLITIPKGPVLTESKITPVEDAQVQGGAYANSNYGSHTVMRVKRGSTEDVNRASYLKFSLSGVPAGVQVKRAILRVYGYNPMDTAYFQFHTYGINSDSWAESTITWNTAPNLHPTASKITDVGNSAFPLGHLTADSTAQIQRVEVTDFINKQLAGDRSATFALVRELRFGDDTADADRHALLNTREATSNRPYLELWW